MKVKSVYTYLFSGLISPEVKIPARLRTFTVDSELEDRYKITFDDGTVDEVMKNSLIARNAKEV